MEQKLVLHNAKWIIGCRILQSLLQFVVGMLCARYLGPSGYGLIGYASSITAFVLPVMKLGLDATLVNELVSDPQHEGEIMGTALGMHVASSFFCMSAVGLAAFAAHPGDGRTAAVCVLYSTGVFAAALEMIQYWFQYKLLSRRASLVMLAAYGIVSVYRIVLLATGRSVYWFALVNALDHGLIGISLIVMYRKLGGQPLRFSRQRAWKLFSGGKYYMIGALLVVVIQNTDHIMLTDMISQAENGYYSAAITCATAGQFVYMALIDSFRPVILAAGKAKQKEFERSISMLYGIVGYLAFAQCVVYELLADQIVALLYGSGYLPAAGVLRILVFYIQFSLMGSVRNIWILARGQNALVPKINLTGAVLNIILNTVFIPVWGAGGAAFASLLTQFCMNFLLGFVYKPLRENNRLLLRGLNPGFLLSALRELARAK